MADAMDASIFSENAILGTYGQELAIIEHCKYSIGLNLCIMIRFK